MSSRYFGRRWQLFRVLVPSWRFFDDPGDEPELVIRSGESAEALGPWGPCIEPAKRGPGALFLNARGNYVLAARSLVDQLLSDLADWDEADLGAFSDSVSFRLVRNLVEFELGGAGRVKAFQFKICSRQGDVLFSSVFEGA